jgi:hypothetical protein
MTRPLLVYDGTSPLVRAAAEAFTHGTDVLPVRWESPAVQAFLKAQFDARPFVFVLVEDGVVHVGSETVERALRERGVGRRLTGLFKRAYPAVAGPFGRVVHGREPADIDGSFRLTDAARTHADRLRRSYEVPVETE